MWALLALIAIPVIEIALFIQVGAWIGVWPTIGLVFLAAFGGVALVRAHGTRVLGAAQAAMRRGEDPGEHVLGAALMLVAAGLFITPGFFTDALALALLLPPVRRALYQAIRSRMRLQATTIVSGYRGPADATPRDTMVIDGDFEDVTPSRRPTHDTSGWTRH